MHLDVFERPSDGFVLVRSRGRFDADILIAAQARLAAVPMIRAGAPVLNDARGVDFGVAPSEIARAGRNLRRQPEGSGERSAGGDNQVALVVGDEVAFGYLRMYLSYRQVRRGRAIFCSVAEALDWLGLPADLDASIEPDARRR